MFDSGDVASYKLMLHACTRICLLICVSRQRLGHPFFVLFLQAMWAAKPRMAKSGNKVPSYVYQGLENDRPFMFFYDHPGGLPRTSSSRMRAIGTCFEMERRLLVGNGRISVIVFIFSDVGIPMPK